MNQDKLIEQHGGILGKIVSKRRIIAIICLIFFGLFLLFWLLHWLTSGSKEIVEDSVKEEWAHEPIKHKIGNIRVGLKIMPSANTENNIVNMDYIRNTDEENEAKNVDKSYHMFDTTVDYFPTLNVIKEYIPVGNPEPYCFHLSWAAVDKSKMSDRYQDFNGMNKCFLVNQGHTIWKSNDPKTGVDVKMWREETYNVGSCGTDENCDYQCESNFKGIYKNKVCYAYFIVERV
jgi:hypothetical protein